MSALLLVGAAAVGVGVLMVLVLLVPASGTRVMSPEEMRSPMRGVRTASMFLMHSISGSGPGAIPPKVRIGEPAGRISE